jgi:hypothetical protein
MRLVLDHGAGSTVSHSVELTELDVAISAKRLAAMLLSERPPLAWSALLNGADVTANFAHVMRSCVYGNEGPEARYFLEEVAE